MYSSCLLFTLFCLLASVLSADFPQCENVKTDSFVSVSDNCTAYVYCNGEDSFRDICPEHTYFDAKAQECAFDDAGVCLKTAASTPANEPSKNPASSSTDKPTNQPDGGDVAAEHVAPARPHCETDGFHAHPQRCEYYYSCISGYLTIVRCPYNYGWDYALQQCRTLAEAKCFSA